MKFKYSGPENYYDLLHELVNIEYQDNHALIQNYEFNHTRDNSIFLEKILYTGEKEVHLYIVNDEEYHRARWLIHEHLGVKEM